MTNLSELLPSGGGAKEFSAVASGTLASGQVVVLKADGKVEAVGNTTLPENIGAGFQFLALSNFPSSYWMGAAYDINSGKHVIAYSDSDNSNAGTVVVATPTGSSLTFGSPVTFQNSQCRDIDIVYANSLNKFLIQFQDYASSGKGAVIVGTVSGDTATFGTKAYYADFNEQEGRIAWSTDDNKFVVVWDDDSGTNYGESRVGTVTGDSISYGTEVAFETSGGNAQGVRDVDVTYTTSSKFVVVYQERNSSNNYESWGRVGTLSGTTMSWSSRALIRAGSTGASSQGMYENRVCYDPITGKVLVSWWDGQNADYPMIAVGTISGTSISFGTAVTINTQGTSMPVEMVYNAAANKIVLSYSTPANTSNTYSRLVTMPSGSSTVPSLSSQINITSGNSTSRTTALSYNSVDFNVLLSYSITASPYSLNAMIYTASYVGPNTSDFIGITSEAIANGATGKVNPQGGVATSQVTSPSAEVGVEAVFETAISLSAVSTFDSTNNRIIVAYMDQGNSNYGTAVVGRINGSTISFGTPVPFVNASIGNLVYNPAITFDSNAGKAIIAFADGSNNNYWTAVVATVNPSDDSITYGAFEVIESAAAATHISIGFDTSSNKCLVIYGDSSNSNYTTGRVGTVSGTDITFGTKNEVINGNGGNTSVAFDSNVNKFAVFYKDPASPYYGKCKVATISGTTVTYGSEGQYAAAVAAIPQSTFDSTANKIVVAFEDQSNSNYSSASVGTISGTNITFGSSSVILNGVPQSYFNHSIVYDSNQNKSMYFLRDAIGGDTGKIYTGTVSGTAITFVFEINFNADADVANVTATYDSAAQKIGLMYTDADNSNYGTGVVYIPPGATAPFVIGSTYYVQNDGNLSTTSSSVTAGKAISTTQLILNGAS